MLFRSEHSPEWDPSPGNIYDATAVVLFSAAVLGTTIPAILAKFTGYNIGFICAVAWNMLNNKLWTVTQCCTQNWSLESGIDDYGVFWEEVSAGTGDLWFRDAESNFAVSTAMMSF